MMKRILFSLLIGSLGSSLFANEIAAEQKKWIAKYQKQANVPQPVDQLLNTDPEPKLDEGFVDLFNGTDLTGWTARAGKAEYSVQDGAIVGKNVRKSPSTYLSTDKEFSDFVFTAELKWEVDGNTGIIFRGGARTNKNGKEEVFGPQAEMEEEKKQRFWSGGIYGQGCGGWFYPLWLEAHGEARAAIDYEGWNRITVKAVGSNVKTWVNGIPATQWENDEFLKGFFSLQIHAGPLSEVHFRNIKVKEL